MENVQPLAYESRQLNKRERNYLAHEKEMMTIIHSLRMWCHGVPYVVKTNNVSSKYFKTHAKLTLKQARWQEFMVEFDFELVCNPG